MFCGVFFVDIKLRASYMVGNTLPLTYILSSHYDFDLHFLDDNDVE